MPSPNSGETKKVTFTQGGEQHAFLVTPFEMSPGRWRAHITRLDGSDVEMVPGGQANVPGAEDEAVGVATDHLQSTHPGAQGLTITPHFP